MVKAEQSVVINRPVQDVFAFVAQDYPRTHPQWATSVKEFRQTSPGPMGVGTKIQSVREINGKPTSATVEITEYVPNQRLAWKEQGESKGSGYLTFQSQNGGTKVDLMVDAEVAGFGRLAGPMISRAMNKELESNLERLKGMLER